MIILNNICVNFGTKSVLKNVSASIDQGDFISIVGANGCGKSTLLDVISGKLKPQSGQLLIEGADVTAFNELQRSASIARLFQDPRLNVVDALSLEENLSLASLKNRRARLKIVGKANVQELPELLRSVRIDDLNVLKKPMSALSGGQRQMVALVMATLCTPKILLLDEPTAALDPSAATSMLQFTAQFVHKHNITTLLVTHDPQIALHMGNKLWVMENGAIKRTFGSEKKHLSAHNLIGDIDFSRLP